MLIKRDLVKYLPWLVFLPSLPPLPLFSAAAHFPRMRNIQVYNWDYSRHRHDFDLVWHCYLFLIGRVSEGEAEHEGGALLEIHRLSAHIDIIDQVGAPVSKQLGAA